MAVLALAGCAGEAYTASPGDPDKPARACLAVDEATPLAMSPADRAACEDTMRGWYAETWYTRPDPADRYTGGAQLDYLRAKALECRRIGRLPADREGTLDGADAMPGHVRKR